MGNCLSYNERDTMFFRAGVKMRDQGGTIIRQARRDIESVGFDVKTGLHTEERLSQKEELSDDKLMKEIDSFMGGGDLNTSNAKESGIPTAEERGMTQNDYLSRLLEHSVRSIVQMHKNWIKVLTHVRPSTAKAR